MASSPICTQSMLVYARALLSLLYSSSTFGKVQSKAIRPFNNPSLTQSLEPLSHLRLVGDLSIFYRYFHGHCSQEIRDIIPVPLRRVRTTKSSTHLHPFQVSLPISHSILQIIIHSVQERAIYGTSCLLLPFPNSVTCYVSSPKVRCHCNQHIFSVSVNLPYDSRMIGILK